MGAADQRRQFKFFAKVVDPATGNAGFHHNQAWLVIIEDCLQSTAVGFHPFQTAFFELELKTQSVPDCERHLNDDNVEHTKPACECFSLFRFYRSGSVVVFVV